MAGSCISDRGPGRRSRTESLRTKSPLRPWSRLVGVCGAAARRPWIVSGAGWSMLSLTVTVTVTVRRLSNAGVA